jgi:hypothetical protein
MQEKPARLTLLAVGQQPVDTGRVSPKDAAFDRLPA